VPGLAIFCDLYHAVVTELAAAALCSLMSTQRHAAHKAEREADSHRMLRHQQHLYNTTSTTQQTAQEEPSADTASGRHKDLFPLSRADIIGLVLAVVGLMLAAGGGIGGGGILVPLYVLIFRFSPKLAVPLSNVSACVSTLHALTVTTHSTIQPSSLTACTVAITSIAAHTVSCTTTCNLLIHTQITVLGGAVANFALNARRRHPGVDRPLVDWDLILVMEPPTIGGALIGSFINKVLYFTVHSVHL
jgi:hypothetical protein